MATLTRGSRFFILAGLLSLFGNKVVPFMEKYSGKVLIVISGMLLLGFYIAYLIYNNYEAFVH